MKRAKDTSGYYLLPLVFLAIGISQLFTPETRVIGITFVVGAIFMGLVAFVVRRRSTTRK